MKCGNCGFEYTEGVSCPMCGSAELWKENGAEDPSAENIEPAAEALSGRPTFEAPKKRKDGKKPYIIVAVTLCAVMLACTAVNIFVTLGVNRAVKRLSIENKTAYNDIDMRLSAVEEAMGVDSSTLQCYESISEGETVDFMSGTVTLKKLKRDGAHIEATFTVKNTCPAKSALGFNSCGAYVMDPTYSSISSSGYYIGDINFKDDYLEYNKSTTITAEVDQAEDAGDNPFLTVYFSGMELLNSSGEAAKFNVSLEVEL